MASKFIRALVDYYQGGELVYKAGNTYPASDTLELLRGRGDAEDYKPEAKQGKTVRKAAAGGADDKDDAAATAAEKSAEQSTADVATAVAAAATAVNTGPAPGPDAQT